MDVPAGSKSLQTRPNFWNLLDIVRDALEFWPPDYIRSFLGPVQTWFPPHDPYSEFTMIDLWQLRRTLKFLMDISVPSVSGAPPAILSTLLPSALEDLFFVQTEVLHRPDYYDDYTSFCDEHWFFVNGILTNGDLAQLNAACLSYLFHRPITLIQNATDGVVRDLWECSLGKEWYANTSNTESARVAFPALYDALKDRCKKKVVVISHSQGTIITAILLHALGALSMGKRGGRVELAPAVIRGGSDGVQIPRAQYIFQEEADLDPSDFEPLTEQEWAKLEVYCFATCCNDLHYHSRLPGCKPVPWVEHFGNEHDLVARLGMLAPHAAAQDIAIEGPFYVRRGAWGHLLNIDYLLPIAEGQKRGRKRGGTGGSAPFALANPETYADAATPRLYSYINGGSPIDG